MDPLQQIGEDVSEGSINFGDLAGFADAWCAPTSKRQSFTDVHLRVTRPNAIAQLPTR